MNPRYHAAITFAMFCFWGAIAGYCLERNQLMACAACASIGLFFAWLFIWSGEPR